MLDAKNYNFLNNYNYLLSNEIYTGFTLVVLYRIVPDRVAHSISPCHYHCHYYSRVVVNFQQHKNVIFLIHLAMHKIKETQIDLVAPIYPISDGRMELFRK